VLLNTLDDVVRSAGVEVYEVPGWTGRNHGAFTSIECIVIHHTAGPKTGDYPSLPIVRDGRPGLDGPLAQLGGGRSGRMYVVANGVAWHAGAVRASWMDNYHAIGIEVESAGDGTPWTSAQLHAVAKTTAALCRAYGVPVARVLGHKEVCSPPGRKVDPIGIPGDMDGFRELVAGYLANPEEDNDMDQTEVIKDSGPGRLNHVWLNTNQLLNSKAFGLAALAAQLKALTTAVAALANDPDIDSMQLQQMLDTSVNKSMAAQREYLEEIVRNTIPAEQADLIVKKLAEKLGAN
jgi:hypothetical protein